jgi:hypothetical protein
MIHCLTYIFVFIVDTKTIAMPYCLISFVQDLYENREVMDGQAKLDEWTGHLQQINGYPTIPQLYPSTLVFLTRI